MGIVKEFKEFAMKGNVVDLAVAVVIGGAFGKIVTSFVNDIIMPPIGVLLGGVDFSDLKIQLKAAVGEVPAVTINYGAWINTLIDFLIVALAIFLVIKALNSLKRRKQRHLPLPRSLPGKRRCCQKSVTCWQRNSVIIVHFLEEAVSKEQPHFHGLMISTFPPEPSLMMDEGVAGASSCCR